MEQRSNAIESNTTSTTIPNLSAHHPDEGFLARLGQKIIGLSPETQPHHTGDVYPTSFNHADAPLGEPALHQVYAEEREEPGFLVRMFHKLDHIVHSSHNADVDSRVHIDGTSESIVSARQVVSEGDHARFPHLANRAIGEKWNLDLERPIDTLPADQALFDKTSTSSAASDTVVVEKPVIAQSSERQFFDTPVKELAPKEPLSEPGFLDRVYDKLSEMTSSRGTVQPETQRDWKQEASDKAREFQHDAEVKANEWKKDAQDWTHDAALKTRDWTHDAAVKTRDLSHDVSVKAGDWKHDAEMKARDLKHDAEVKADDLKRDSQSWKRDAEVKAHDWKQEASVKSEEWKHDLEVKASEWKREATNLMHKLEGDVDRGISTIETKFHAPAEPKIPLNDDVNDFSVWQPPQSHVIVPETTATELGTADFKNPAVVNDMFAPDRSLAQQKEEQRVRERYRADLTSMGK